MKAVTKETWKQFGKLICRAKDGNVAKVNVNNGLWNQTIIEFVNEVIRLKKEEEAKWSLHIES